MKLSIHGVGRMKKGPERELFERYWQRALSIGKSQGIQPLVIRELCESKAGRPADRMAQEAADILNSLDDKAFVIALDERGETMTSPDFAKMVRRVRDDGSGEIVFVIGGADGLDEKVRARANKVIGFGAMTWPHQLVRIMVSEQIYRSLAILAGHPYHKI